MTESVEVETPAFVVNVRQVVRTLAALPLGLTAGIRNGKPRHPKSLAGPRVLTGAASRVLLRPPAVHSVQRKPRRCEARVTNQRSTTCAAGAASRFPSAGKRSIRLVIRIHGHTFNPALDRSQQLKLPAVSSAEGAVCLIRERPDAIQTYCVDASEVRCRPEIRGKVGLHLSKSLLPGCLVEQPEVGPDAAGGRTSERRLRLGLPPR